MEAEIRNKLLQCIPGNDLFVDEHLMKPFCLSDESLCKLRDIMDKNITQAFSSETRALTPLKLWPSYVTNMIETIENGTYLALDLGGTNLRVMSVTVQGTTTSSDMTSNVIPDNILRGTGTELFDFIAEKLYTFAESHNLLQTPEPLSLGFTFSFPVDQKGLNNAVLQSWTKEFVCQDVIGNDVGKLMQDAIDKKSGMNIRCVAIINDTVGTLISGMFLDRSCTIGLICGTGTNGCLFDTQENLGIQLQGYDKNTRVAVDTMWNNFGNDGSVDFLRSQYDFDIAREATHHESQCEKMMCAMFAGETVRHVILNLQKCGICFSSLSSKILEKDSITAETMSDILRDETDDLSRTRDILTSLGQDHVTEVECRIVYLICKLVTMRAAALVAACLSCLLNRGGLPDNGIAVDGSFYRGNSLLPDLCYQRLAPLVSPGLKYHFVPCQDGSGLGAALVAAMKLPS